MEPIYADFSIDPARLGNVVVSHGGCFAAASHLKLDAGGWVELRFDANGPGDTAQAVVNLTALVSKRGPLLGHAPIDVLINGVPVIEGYVIPGGDLPADTALAVPGEHLVAGTNVLRIQTSARSLTYLWLYRITVDTAENRGGAVLAMRRETAQTGSVFAYRAERRPAKSESWLPATRVLVHVDRGEYVELRRLSWRDEDGAEAAVSFHSAMVSFYGHHRAKDGTVSEFRGERLSSRAAPQDAAPAATHVFRTQEGWGGGWHGSSDLRLLVDDEGGADMARVSWQDEAGNTGSVELDLPTPGERGMAEHGDITDQVTEVAASGENPGSGEVAVNLLDGSTQSKWLAFSGTARLDFTLGHREAVGAYELTSANDFAVRDPRDWTLSGSSDRQTWTVLDARSDEVFAARHEQRIFRVRRSMQAVYRYYRLEISRTAGSARQVQLAGVRFFRPAAVPALGFLGYYQRPGEGPIGYRGIAVAAAPRVVRATTGTLPTTPGTGMGRVPGRPGVGRPGTPLTPAIPARRSVAAKRSTAVRATPARPKMPSVPASGKAAAEITVAPQDAVTAVEPSLTTVAGWQAYLAEYGADIVRTMDERHRGEFTQDQLSRGWLGGDPVDEARIAAVEARLGKRLPATYRAFVGAGDGWRHLGQFMYVMHGIDEIDWFRFADPQTCEILGGDEHLGPILRRALLISKEGDAQFWFLDPGDVSPDGEWAAYTWSSWGFLSERHPSFAALVADERRTMERLRANHGRPMHPEGADELLAEGRAQALRGDVDAALQTFDQAAIKGSGAAAYLKVILGIFLDSRNGHHQLRNGVFARSHIKAAVGSEQLRAEAVPLFLHLTHKDPVTGFPAYLPLLEDFLPELPDETADVPRGRGADAAAVREASRAQLMRRLAAFVPPVLPEPPAFQSALDEARALVQSGNPGSAWAVIEAALPAWHSDSATRVAPVILLTDPVLNTLITPSRARQIARTSRGAGIDGKA